MTLGEYLREKREARGVGLNQLSRAARYDRSTLAKIERGTREPSLTVLNAYARHLRLSQEESDEMFALALRMPPDIAALALIHKGIFRLLRENVPHAEKQSGAFVAIGIKMGKQ